MNKPKEDTLKMVDKLGIKLTSEDKELEGKPLLKVLAYVPDYDKWPNRWCSCPNHYNYSIGKGC